MAGLKYVGDGEWIEGVPARDLSEEEVKAHKDAIEATQETTGRVLYEPAKGKGKG